MKLLVDSNLKAEDWGTESEERSPSFRMQTESICEMLQTVWAVIHDGKIEPLEGVAFPEGAKVIVTLLPVEEELSFWLSASEPSLSQVWESPEDDIYAELLKN